MQRFLTAFFFLSIGFYSCNLFDDTERNQIEDTLLMQQSAWNDGDIDGFMEGYWNNDSLMFVSRDSVSYGWQQVSDNYKANYTTLESMGQLTFGVIKLERLSDEAYFMVGSWELSKSMGHTGGKFTLLWKRIDGKWVIVADHTS